MPEMFPSYAWSSYEVASKDFSTFLKPMYGKLLLCATTFIFMNADRA